MSIGDEIVTFVGGIMTYVGVQNMRDGFDIFVIAKEIENASCECDVAQNKR